MIMDAVCRHTDKSSGLTQEGAGPCCPHPLPAPAPRHQPVLPQSLCSLHVPVCRVAAPTLSTSGPSSSVWMPGLSLSLSLTFAPARPALLCLWLPSPCLPLPPSLGSGKNTAQFSSHGSMRTWGATPALCQDFPLAREPTSPPPPRTASTQVRLE